MKTKIMIVLILLIFAVIAVPAKATVECNSVTIESSNRTISGNSNLVTKYICAHDDSETNYFYDEDSKEFYKCDNGADCGRFNDHQVALLQLELAMRNHNPGPIDGILGPKTKKAIADCKAATYKCGSDTIMQKLIAQVEPSSAPEAPAATASDGEESYGSRTPASAQSSSTQKKSTCGGYQCNLVLDNNVLKPAKKGGRGKYYCDRYYCVGADGVVFAKNVGNGGVITLGKEQNGLSVVPPTSDNRRGASGGTIQLYFCNEERYGDNNVCASDVTTSCSKSKIAGLDFGGEHCGYSFDGSGAIYHNYKEGKGERTLTRHERVGGCLTKNVEGVCSAANLVLCDADKECSFDKQRWAFYDAKGTILSQWDDDISAFNEPDCIFQGVNIICNPDDESKKPFYFNPYTGKTDISAAAAIDYYGSLTQQYVYSISEWKNTFSTLFCDEECQKNIQSVYVRHPLLGGVDAGIADALCNIEPVFSNEQGSSFVTSQAGTGFIDMRAERWVVEQKNITVEGGVKSAPAYLYKFQFQIMPPAEECKGDMSFSLETRKEGDSKFYPLVFEKVGDKITKRPFRFEVSPGALMNGFSGQKVVALINDEKHTQFCMTRIDKNGCFDDVNLPSTKCIDIVENKAAGNSLADSYGCDIDNMPFDTLCDISSLTPAETNVGGVSGTVGTSANVGSGWGRYGHS